MLKRKTAIITGSSTRGIGLAIARELAASGADIVLNGLGDPDAIEGYRAAISRDFGVQARYDDADLAEPAQIQAMVESAESEFGGVDIVVNNAGIRHLSPVEEFPIEAWNNLFSVNVSAAFHAIRAALPGMKARQWGRIVNISSAMGLIGASNQAGYAASKHALVGLSKVVALEAAEHGITCNAICPGAVWTEFAANAMGLPFEDTAIESLVSDEQPNKRFVRPEQVGALAAFLCTDGADQINGAILPIDGGWMAG